MSYLIDTNIISELARPNPNEAVTHWFKNTPVQAIYLSVLTLGELRKGIEKLDSGSKKIMLGRWLEHDLCELFAGNILAIDDVIAQRWGCIVAFSPQPLPVIDALLAATALRHNLKFVTRNVRDFNIPGLEVVNPFIYL